MPRPIIRPNLYKYRVYQLGLSRQGFGDLLGITGQCIRRLEEEPCRPWPATLAKIRKGLALKIEEMPDLMKIEEPKEKQNV